MNNQLQVFFFLKVSKEKVTTKIKTSNSVLELALHEYPFMKISNNEKLPITI